MGTAERWVIKPLRQVHSELALINKRKKIKREPEAFEPKEELIAREACMMSIYGNPYCKKDCSLHKTSDICIKTTEKSSTRDWWLNIHRMVIFYQNSLIWKS